MLNRKTREEKTENREQSARKRATDVAAARLRDGGLWRR